MLVFISYSRDDEDRALSLQSRLANFGFELFVDTEGIDVGARWRAKRLEALDRAFAVLVICTKRSIESREVIFEWSYALGHGLLVVPLLYEKDLVLHSQLEELQALDFSHVRRRPWGDLAEFLRRASDFYTPTVEFLRSAGISRVIFSRDDLLRNYSIRRILDSLKEGSMLQVVARTCEAWARQYEHLQSALVEKKLGVRLAIANPSLAGADWMIAEDEGIFDVNSIADKLRRIKVPEDCEGSLELYYLPNAPLMSLVSFTEQDDTEVGILEIGANLSLEERVGVVLKSSRSSTSILFDRVAKVHSMVFDGRSPALSIPGGGSE